MDFMGRLTFKTQFFSNMVPKKQCLFKNITSFYFYFFFLGRRVVQLAEGVVGHEWEKKGQDHFTIFTVKLLFCSPHHTVPANVLAKSLSMGNYKILR